MAQYVKVTLEEVQKRCTSANFVDVSGVHACISSCDNYLCFFDNGPYGCNMWNDYSKCQSCKFINDNFEDDDQDVMMTLRDDCVP
eukprot:6778409-Ditylum_brightwellii.AAC.1